MKQLAIIGSTASGKSALALELAKTHNAVILSIDSLSIYRFINIASAKPTADELSSVRHFGIDVLNPDENANVFTFIDEYHHASTYAQQMSMNLLIIGGSSFYLKSMLDGLSDLPDISDNVRQQVVDMLSSTQDAHRYLSSIDPISASKISTNDRYRLEKLLHLYFQTKVIPSVWFAEHPPKPILTDCPVLNLSMDREQLRQRIELRTHQMVQNGLIDEVAHLEKTYGRHPNSMKAIGIVETLQFLDGEYDKSAMINAISTHTAQLAKRQSTFNMHQFTDTLTGDISKLFPLAEKLLS